MVQVTPTIKQRIALVGEDRALRETEAWIDGLLAENKRLKFQQDQLRLIIGSGEPLHVDHETLLELAHFFKQDLKEAREENVRLKLELDHARKTSVYLPPGSTIPSVSSVAGGTVPLKGGVTSVQLFCVNVRIFGEDYPVFTSESHTVEEVVDEAFDRAEADPGRDWELFDISGSRLRWDQKISSTNTTIVVSLPIGHGG